MALQPADLARMIDHTLLRPDATQEQVRRLCAEAVRHGFWSVCVASKMRRTRRWSSSIQ